MSHPSTRKAPAREPSSSPDHPGLIIPFPGLDVRWWGIDLTPDPKSVTVDEEDAA